MAVSGRPRALLLNARDNVAVAVKPLAAGEVLDLGQLQVEVAEPIPFGHKLALRAIAQGADVIKYGEVIGRASAPIEPGRHVHVQNVVSARLPGEAEEEG